MWMITMFDLPTGTLRVRTAYARFRKDSLDDVIMTMQYSGLHSVPRIDGERQSSCSQNGAPRSFRGRGSIPDDHRQAVGPDGDLCWKIPQGTVESARPFGVFLASGRTKTTFIQYPKSRAL